MIYDNQKQLRNDYGPSIQSSADRLLSVKGRDQSSYILHMCKAVNITPCSCWRAREDTDMPVINITTAVATPNYTDNSEIC